MKTIDVNAKEWFDKVNGNSYFSAQVTVNYGMNDEKTLYIPFQYGYGDQYRHEAFQALQREGIIPEHKNNVSYWRYYEDNNIISRHSKIKGCKKRDVIAFGVE